LLWDNALRRAEVCSLNIEDYQRGESKLLIKGKGKLTKEPPVLSSLDSLGKQVETPHLNGLNAFNFVIILKESKIP
jgi:integrase